MRATVLTSAALLALFTPACRKAAPAAAEQPSGPPVAVPARCVYFQDLRGFLPEAIPGFKQIHDEGSTGKYGDVQVSEAKRTFSQAPGRELSVRIVDTTMSQDLGRAIEAAAKDGADRPKNDPTAPLFLNEAVGFVRFESAHSDPTESHAEATLWVGERFVVAVTGRGFTGTAEVREVAQKLDLAGLSKLRLDAARRGP